MATSRIIPVASRTNSQRKIVRFIVLYKTSSLLTKQNLTPLRTLNFPTESSLSYTASSTRTLADDYMTVVDVSPTDNFAPFTNPKPSTENNLSVDLLNGWYDVIASTPVVPAATVSTSNDQLFPFEFPQSQTNTFNDNFASLSTSQPTYANLLDEPVPYASSTANVPISTNSRPSISSDSTSKSSSPTKEPMTFANGDPSSTKKKKKKKLPKILHLSLKGKNETKTDPILEEVS